MFAVHGKKGQKLDQNEYVNVSGPQFSLKSNLSQHWYFVTKIVLNYCEKKMF